MKIKGKFSTYDVSWTRGRSFGDFSNDLVPMVKIYKITSFFGLFTIRVPGHYIPPNFGYIGDNPTEEYSKKLFEMAVQSYESTVTPWIKDTWN